MWVRPSIRQYLCTQNCRREVLGDREEIEPSVPARRRLWSHQDAADEVWPLTGLQDFRVHVGVHADDALPIYLRQLASELLEQELVVGGQPLGMPEVSRYQSAAFSN